MAQLDFPDNPVVGETYGSSGVIWRWDGSRWVSTSGGAYPRGRVAYAEITTNQTGITGVVTIGGLNPTFQAVAGRTYKITTHVRTYSSVANDWGVFSVLVNGAQYAQETLPWMGVNSGMTFHTEVVYAAQTSQAVGVTVQFGRAVGSGTYTVWCAPGNANWVLVEDITYDASVGSNTAPIGTVFYSTFTAPALVAGSVNPCTLHSPGSVTLVTGAMYVGTVCGGPFQGPVTQAAWGCGPFGAWWQKPVSGWSSFMSSVPVTGNATTYNLTTINLGDPAVAVTGGGGSYFRVERVK